jgi:hypothetical protein
MDVPQANLLNFLKGLASQAMMQFGELPNPMSGSRERNLPYARYTVELLGVLELKTRGNRDAEEERYLVELLADCRRRLAQLEAEA